MCVAGIAITPSSPTLTATIASGRRVTSLAQRTLMVSAPAARRRGRHETTRFERTTRWPANPRTAGSSVSAISTAMLTVPAAAMPMAVRNGMLTTSRPTRAITTVAPANTTALPAVAVACAAASRPSLPSARFWR